MKCVIIEDEPMALELIAGYCNKLPFIELQETFTNPVKALDFLGRINTDILILDINMPELTGIQILNALPHPPLVIFTTAYPEFAAESYNYNAVDYLLKPVSFDRFLKAINKARDIFNTTSSGNKKPDTEYIFIKSGNRTVKLMLSDITHVAADGNYMSFHTKEQKIMSLMNMTEALKLLPETDFIRVHKSYIIAIGQISSFDKDDIFINDICIPIGNTYKEDLVKKISPPDSWMYKH
jgi:DNA-binding LytR/AlgR family response regulator